MSHDGHYGLDRGGDGVMSWLYFICYVFPWCLLGGVLIALAIHLLTSFGDDGITTYTRWHEADMGYLQELPQIEQPAVEIELPRVIEEQPTPHTVFWQQAARRAERARK